MQFGADLFASLEDQYGLPTNYLSQTAKIESSGNPNAFMPGSKAAGLFQFIPSTAKAYGLADPYDPAASADAAARLARDNFNTLKAKLGRDPTSGELYLAHQQGGGGATKLLLNPEAPAASVVGRAAVVQNGGRPDMTAAEFAQKWTSKFGGEGGTAPSSAMAFNSTPTARQTTPTTQGATSMAGNELRPEDFLPQAQGGLGGLGGLAPVLQAVGMSLMSSDRLHPFAGVPGAMQAQQKAQLEEQARQLQLAQLKYGMARDNRSAALEERKFDLSREDKRTDNERQATQAIGQYAAATTARTGLKPGQEGYWEAYKETAKIMQDAGGGDFAKTPIWGTDANNQPAIVQIGSNGQAIQTKLPEGVRVGKDAIKIDAGTHTVLLDPVTRQQIGIVPKNVAEAATQREIGEATGKNVTAAPKVYETAKQTYDLVESAINHPGRQMATGRSALLNPITQNLSTDVAGFMSRMDQIKGQSFLQAFDNLRGAGAISEKEGDQAKAAVARLGRMNVDEGEYVQALRELQQLAARGMKKAEEMQKLGVSKGMPDIGGTAINKPRTTKTGVEWSFD